jgi:hypothetical protein
MTSGLNVFLVRAALFATTVSADGPKFLGSKGQHVSAAGMHSFIVTDLLHELERVAGRDHRDATESRTERLEKALRPMFEAMPHDPDGHLDSTSVRYLLHRLFVQRHGWSVNGLETGGEAWNSSSPAAIFKDHAMEHHNLFEDRLNKHGFTLHQVAVFAATLETLVHRDSLERLDAAYRVLGLTKSEALSESEAKEAIRAYMVLYVSSANFSSVSRAEFQTLSRDVYGFYPTFPDTEQFVYEVRSQILEDAPDTDRNNWQTNLKVVEEVAERYGRWQNQECHVLKGMLVGMEKRGTGRVSLEDFYGPALNNGSWQFTESVPYLRQLGALDESDPKRMSVIIPNYLNSLANCVAGSKFYDVCCIDECESILGSIETSVAAPDASPERIVELIEALPSDTVEAPRKLPASLVQRLEQVALHHRGRVPLHGRLFAQWMHHAYPRECPFPHVSGTTNPLTQEEWAANTDVPIAIESHEIRKLLQESSANAASTEIGQASIEIGQELPWSHEEELFLGRLPEHRRSSTLSNLLMFFAVAASGVLVAQGIYAPPKKSVSVGARGDHKYYV